MSNVIPRPAAGIGPLLILTFALTAPSIAEQAGQAATDAAAWASCQRAPTRRCVLRHAFEVALRLQRGGATSPSEVLYRIAIAQFELGLAREASDTIDLLGKTSGWDRVRARIKAAAGKLDEAASIAYDGATIGEIAIAEAEAGSIDAALRRVQSVVDASERAAAVRRVAWGLRFTAVKRGEDGKIAEALRQVQSIPLPYGLQEWASMPALQIIVDAQIRGGKVAEAMQAARSVEDPREREAVLAAVLLALSYEGRVSEGLRILLTIDDLRERKGVLLHALEYKPQWVGTAAWEPPPGASVMTPGWSDKLSPQPLSDRVLSPDDNPGSGEYPAVVQGKVDPEALAVARSFPDLNDRESALLIVAEAQARAGEPDQAAEAAQIIDGDRDRFRALLAVGLAQAKAGRRAQAVAFFEQAAQIIAPKPEPAASLFARFGNYLRERLGGPHPDMSDLLHPDMSYLLPELGLTEAKADLIAEAKAVAESIKGEGDRGRVLYEVARAQARAARTAEALQTAEIAYMLLGLKVSEEIVVAGLAEGGHVSELIPILERLSESFKRARPFTRNYNIREVAISLARAGNTSGALQVAQIQDKTESPEAWIETLAQVALALRQAGAGAGAAAAIRMAMDSVVSEPYLLERHLPEQLTYLSYALPD